MPSYRLRRASAQPDRGVVRDKTMSQPISGGLAGQPMRCAAQKLRRGLLDYRFQLSPPYSESDRVSITFVAGQKAHSECVVRINLGAAIPAGRRGP
jgi:hypothetical protein